MQNKVKQEEGKGTRVRILVTDTAPYIARGYDIISNTT